MCRRPGGVGLRSERLGITGAMGPSTLWDPWPYPVARAAVGTKSVHRSAKTASRSRFGAFVYTIATRAASGGTRASTAMARRRRPLAGPLPLGRENRLRASGAATSLASSLMSSLTQTPEEPNSAWLALTIIAGVIGCTVSSFHSPYGSGQRLVLLGYTG